VIVLVSTQRAAHDWRFDNPSVDWRAVRVVSEPRHTIGLRPSEVIYLDGAVALPRFREIRTLLDHALIRAGR
jgi:hypothetical protein